MQSLSTWGEWHPLAGAGSNRAFPAEPGLYRIRRVGEEVLDYIGQTGRSLRGRLGQLNGVYREVMPYNDPHTAGPCLWALRESLGCDFEASALPVAGDVRWRKALEATAISLHRLNHGRSPTANFGRMPDGYRKSSGNNQRLVLAGKRFRGGRDESFRASVHHPPPDTLEGDPAAASWLGLDWTDWQPATASVPARSMRGIYRLSAGAVPLVYVGQGVIAARIATHLAKARTPSSRQQEAMSGSIHLSWSNVDLPLSRLLEIENDLIASHVVSIGQPPTAQFLG